MTAKNIQDIKIEDIHDLFDSIIFLRGEEYFEEGLVTSIEPVDSCTITGTVRGNQNYNVSISVDADGDILCDCSCPCDFNCKHAAALLLKWLSIKNKFIKKLKQVKPLKKETLTQILTKKSKEELIELVETFVDKHPELKSYVAIERKELTSKIKALFSGFWDWHEIRSLISQLETILEGIRKNKNQWDKKLLEEIKVCSTIIMNNFDNIYDEGDLGIFLEDWFLTYGEIFTHLKPTVKQKKEFIQTIIDWVDEDDYGYDGSYNQALLGMCTTEKDIQLIKEFTQTLKLEYYDDYYDTFLLQLYDKIGMNKKYIEIARELGLTTDLIDKLISLNRYDEALKECEEKCKKEFSLTIENKRISILKKLGRKNEVQKSLLYLLEKTGNLSYFIKLKQESSKNEWKKYLKDIIFDAENKKRHTLLSRIYYDEHDYKKSYEYVQSMTDINYLELLAKKLRTNHPELACNIFKKLCYEWIDAGSGWPYKKAGKMLEAIKKIDKKEDFFEKTKKEIILKHKKKWSLMDVIENI
ncbi:MAG: SWIM zinc finger family protein [Thermoplasmatales archaeon]|nr:SWIM zinc finger family protein [Thermoplasmatales archaeon]